MNILLLQSPLGSFFQKLAKALTQSDHQVYKVHFNGGDAQWPICGTNYHYRGYPKSWQHTCEKLIKQWRIQMVICYGDCRIYHRAASKVCQALNIPFWVFEEGYIRSNYITFEAKGVNANSPFYQNPARLFTEITDKIEPPKKIKPRFAVCAIVACRYYWAKSIMRFKYPHFVHHRSYTCVEEGWNWLKSGYIKVTTHAQDRRYMQHIRALHQAKHAIFMLPLQVSDDFQLRAHSDFSSIEHLIDYTLASFAKHSPRHAVLVIKHHPMDKGHIDYQPQIKKRIEQLQLHGRVFFLNYINLPKFYAILTGLVTVNSTVGMSALHHGTPTLCLGKAVYDHSGITTQSSLRQFWHQQTPVDKQKFALLKHNLLLKTQLNGNFYVKQSIAIEGTLKKIEAQQTYKTQLRRTEKITSDFQDATCSS